MFATIRDLEAFLKKHNMEKAKYFKDPPFLKSLMGFSNDCRIAYCYDSMLQEVKKDNRFKIENDNDAENLVSVIIATAFTDDENLPILLNIPINEPKQGFERRLLHNSYTNGWEWGYEKLEENSNKIDNTIQVDRTMNNFENLQDILVENNGEYKALQNGFVLLELEIPNHNKIVVKTLTEEDASKNLPPIFEVIYETQAVPVVKSFEIPLKKGTTFKIESKSPFVYRKAEFGPVVGEL